MTTNDEKRKHIRHSITGIRESTAEKPGVSKDGFNINMFDLSAGGAGFSSHEKLEKGDTISFFFSLPGVVEKKVGARGTIVRVVEQDVPSGEPLFSYGLKIHNFITEQEISGIDSSPVAVKVNTAEKNEEICMILRKSEISWLRNKANERNTTPAQILSELIANSDR